MSGLEVSFDGRAIARLGNMMAAAGKQLPIGIMRALNHTGDKARTQMGRVLVPQTGLRYGTIRKALKRQGASPGKLTYAIKSRGGNVRLRFFKARETRAGVTAAPWNARRLYAGTFMKGGRFPNRVGLNMGGQVLRRVGKGRTPLKAVKSGLYIPTEMTSGASAGAFHSTVEAHLPGRLAHELARILSGA